MDRVSATLKKLVDFVASAAALGVTPGDKAEILWRETKNLRVALHMARYHPDTISPLRTRYGTIHLRDNFGDVTNLPATFCQSWGSIQCGGHDQV